LTQLLRFGILPSVARKIRLQYPGAVYHVMNRGDRREAVFHGEEDYQLFLRTLEQACQKALWQVHAYCLMPNHFHLVLETPQPTLVTGMKWLMGTYTARFNRRRRQFGHLFSGRYKALVVDGSGHGYLKTVCDYVHLNPVRGRRLQAGQPLEVFRWSSYPLYLASPRQRPSWLRVDRLLGEWRIARDSAAGRRVFGEGMERRRREDLTGEFKPVERGWRLGGEEFRRQLLEQISRSPGGSHYGEAVQESVEARAERRVKERLRAMEWTEQDLAARRKGDAAKVTLAAAIRAETTMPLAWIAQRLRMGSRGYLTWLLQRQGKRHKI
jgi:REP element-mobilizing transposase RayT